VNNYLQLWRRNCRRQKVFEPTVKLYRVALTFLTDIVNLEWDIVSQAKNAKDKM
jgi:hypothetical protein